MSKPRVLTTQDMETLCMAAEDVLDELCGINFYGYDHEGNRLFSGLPGEERRAAIRQAAEGQTEPRSWDYITLSGNRTFRQTTFLELRGMPMAAIQARYLEGMLPKARGVLRKGTMKPGLVVSDEVPDRVLDEILAMTWLGKLIWWTTLRELLSEKSGEGKP